MDEKLDKKIEKAIKLFEDKEWEKAIDAFSRILEKSDDSSDDNAEIYNNLALSYFYIGEHEQAEKFFLKSIGMNPKLPQVYINLADLYFRQRNFADAIDLLQMGTRELPDNLVIKHYLARIYMEDAHLDLAIDELDKILEEQPENYDAYYDLARIYFEFGNYDLAIQNFENVIEYKDDNEWVYYYLGQSYEGNNEVDKALSNYLKAIAVNDKFHPAYKKAAILFLARNDFEDAIEYFEDYIKLDIPEEEIKNTKKTIERIKSQKQDK